MHNSAKKKFCFGLVISILSLQTLFSQTQESDDKQEQTSSNLSFELIQAINEKNITQVEDLLKKGADPNADYYSGIPIWEAVLKPGRYQTDRIKKDIDIMKLLLAYGAKQNIYNCSFAGNLDCVQSLSQKFDLNALEPYSGRAALTLASMTGHYEILEYLINKGADVNTLSTHEKTALHYVSDINSLNLLIDNGAELELKTKRGRTPLFSAIRWDKSEIAIQLIKKGADIFAEENEMNSSLLHLAAIRGNAEIVKFLIRKGIDVNKLDLSNNTPLGYALMRKKFEVANILIEKGADVNKKIIKSERKYSYPIHYVVKYGDLELTKLLLKMKANIDLKNNYGETPLDIAISYKNEEIELLLKSTLK